MAKKRLALLIPAHNEELLIQETLKSAIRAGLNKRDIYLVDDASSDKTVIKAKKILSSRNILSLEHSGKAGAVMKALKHFKIAKKYHWVHIADADSIFSKNYFHEYSEVLSDKYVAAVGMVQSLRGNWLCSYRAVSYTYGQHLIKLIQSMLGVVTVMPGPVTSYRTDILKHLDFETGSLTEDFDITLQIHRKKLGKIKFVPEAINYTQDPRTVKDYYNQSLRWYRGFFQGLKRYKVGIRLHKIDIAVLFQLGEIILFLMQILTAILLLTMTNNGVLYLQRFAMFDISVVALIILYATIVNKRPILLLVIFYYHFLKFFELSIYIKSFFEVLVFNSLNKKKTIGWSVAGRRYKLSKDIVPEAL